MLRFNFKRTWKYFE